MNKKDYARRVQTLRYDENLVRVIGGIQDAARNLHESELRQRTRFLKPTPKLGDGYLGKCVRRH